MEKAWEVKIAIWNSRTFTREDKLQELHIFAHTLEGAKTGAIIEAVKRFPSNDGWAYDFDNMAIRERTPEEVGEFIEQRRAEIAQESEEILNKTVAEFEEKTGIKLKKPSQ